MKIIKNMEFIQTRDPNIKKPIIIAAMQDMGNVGSIVINFINQSLKTESFRTAKVSFPTYVIDNGGSIDLPNESWDYKFTDDLIIFGGGKGQPQNNNELNLLCQDVIDVAKKYDIQGIGMYGEINQPELPQYRAPNSIIKTIEKLTYRKLGNTEELEMLAQEMDQKFRN